MYSNSVFLFLCLGGPVAPASVLTHQECGRLLHNEASLYICTLLLRSSQAKMKSKYSFCGLTQLSAIQLYSFSRYYEYVCMIQRQMYICTCEDMYYQQKPLCERKGNRLEWTSELCGCSVLCTQSDWTAAGVQEADTMFLKWKKEKRGPLLSSVLE